METTSIALVISASSVFFQCLKLSWHSSGLQDDYGDERETNLAAVISAAAQWGGLKMVIKAGLTLYKSHTIDYFYSSVSNF